MITQSLNGIWRMRRVGDDGFQEAVVPGTVYTDLLRNGQMEDPFFKDNEQKALKLMDEDYEYVTEFPCGGGLSACDRVLLHFDGIDTLADIYLNGVHLGDACNMHRIWEFEVKQLLRPEKNELRVVLHSPTKYIAEAFKVSQTHGSEDAMDGFVNIRKAHCMFGWDWGAHLPDAGLFRPVTLLGIDEARLESVYIRQEHGADAVTLHFEVEASGGGCGKADARGLHYEAETDGGGCGKADAQGLHYEVTVTAPDGTKITAAGSPGKLVIENPQLWWPNGYGEQNLYTVEVALYAGAEACGDQMEHQTQPRAKKLDVWERRIGLRTMTVHREKDQWGESFAFQVNGIDIFAMGADYIPEDHLLGRVTPQTTRTLLEKAKWANFNCIRVWGGGYYPEDWFYDICDELGLVVWQDFMFACALYDLTPEFEANIRAEFIDNIKRLRHHASLGLWCGNNEMEQFVFERNEWLTKPQEVRDYFLMYERIIPEILQKYDPQTFYWPASPSSGGSLDFPQDPDRGDVHYWEVWHGNKPFTEYRKYFFRFVSEFGFQSFPAMKTIEQISDDPSDYNIFSYVMEKHQRNGSANGKIMNYMQQTYRYPSDFRTVLYASQLLQADAIRYGVEHFRRNRGRCMGAVYWQLNDCWPVASWSSVDYCGRLKALHYYAGRFFAPLLLSCEEQGLMTSGKDLNREHFTFEKSIRLNVANETREEAVVTVRYALRNPKAEILRSGEEKVMVPALTSVWLDKVEFPDADIYTEYISYELEKDGEILSDGTVNFSYPKYFRYEDPELTYRLIGDEIEVSAKAYAKSVEILNEEENLLLSDNYFDMNAGTKRVKILGGEPVGIRLRSVYDIK
ncbi:glycosyl hydrolase family 2, sugar binding domain protein [Marvinbryantia formatexigens DSM 14469]|uniref:Beta-mannosidase B n=1 Tax=Marvinbryantia formatexigens DSM 14469 TaxID=478749 RepID=C6LE21_9FIRM|nr:glycoside hydrolase family 2 protein [Marvinbryantia formatexigens]EET61225.1 glycosyl hydrolase family 2, sugar binding domain protein [Marvinbryantia formatexigens DSM 14469]UWO23776.1 glycoside hydrolase family 2 protein [Marvinbryantia formatexigens DSM 14469]SDF70453.1 beta-mannosidase [Marvinbryantia formatexigens]